ncbi:NAD-dependent epimerase/dehydratase family protein [Paenibacillus sp. FSL W7-1279]|uniref:NAD-dependent epimerase/dehydratase family protein n=1 Tax=Paenibacillus sp. FSL W7-1279 TaxID=2921697 RepID=UPI0030DBAF6C
MKKETYVILGCGYLGYHLANYFHDENKDVRIIGKSSYYVDKLHPSITFYEANLFNVEDYEDVIPANSIVIHAVNHINSTNSFIDLEYDLQSNYTSFIKLINVCERKEVRKFVFISSAGTVYGDTQVSLIQESHPLRPVNIYGLQKVYFENLLRIKMLESNEFHYVVLRVSNPYGGQQDPLKKQGIIPIMINKALSGEAIELWVSQNTVRDFIFINDFLKATDLIIKKTKSRGDEFNVGSGQGNSLAKAIDLIEEATGRKIEVVHKAACTATIHSNALNISKIREMGFIPRYSLKEGIDQLVNQMA